MTWVRGGCGFGCGDGFGFACLLWRLVGFGDPCCAPGRDHGGLLPSRSPRRLPTTILVPLPAGGERYRGPSQGGDFDSVSGLLWDMPLICAVLAAALLLNRP